MKQKECNDFCIRSSFHTKYMLLSNMKNIFLNFNFNFCFLCIFYFKRSRSRWSVLMEFSVNFQLVNLIITVIIVCWIFIVITYYSFVVVHFGWYVDFYFVFVYIDTHTHRMQYGHQTQHLCLVDGVTVTV